MDLILDQNRRNLLYIIQNGIIGLAATLLAFGLSRLCLALMGEFVASMGIVLNTTAIFPLELAIMGIVFVIRVLPTVVSTFNMSRKDGIEE